MKLLLVLSLLEAAYLFGYSQARKQAKIEYFEGPEGYCLADTPPHPGQCK